MKSQYFLFGLILFSVLSPFVIGSSSAQSELIFKSDDSECGIESFSPAIWSSYVRVANLHSYTSEELKSTSEWVFTLSSGFCTLDMNSLSTWANGIDAELISMAGKLDQSWIIKFNHFDFDKVAEELSNEDFIDAFYPLVPKQQEKKFIPNDPNFDEQWHLENTGQDGGTSGEDANVTGAWNTVTGTGATIAIVDDGLDHAHPDLNGNYLSAHSWDYCDGDSDPTPGSSGDGHGTSAAGVAAAIIGFLVAEKISISLHDIFLASLAGFFQIGFGFILITLGSQTTPAAVVGVLMLTESVFGPLWAWLFINEIPPLGVLIGGSIIIFSILFQTFLNKNQ